MKRILVCSVLAALAIQVWGILYWAVSLLSFHFMRPLPDQERMISVLSDAVPETGVYRFPFPQDGQGDEQAAMDAFVARHRAGPLGTVFLRKEGSDPMSPMTIVKGLLHNIVASLLVAWLLVTAAPAVRSYWARVLFVGGVGLLAAFWVGLSPPIWLQHPWGYSLFNAVYIATAWLIAGLVLARVVREEAT